MLHIARSEVCLLLLCSPQHDTEAVDAQISRQVVDLLLAKLAGALIIGVILAGVPLAARGIAVCSCGGVISKADCSIRSSACKER